MMSDEEFERLVGEGLDAIPEKYLHRLQNVAVVIADTPSQLQRTKTHLGRGWTLFGLYEGIPLTERGELYGGLVLPDKITIFKDPILEHADNDPTKIRDIVRDTVWHEIAHYFGYNDNEIEEREEKGTNHSREP